uniref:Uncharacterized protein n=1 Tax=Strigamia maritima TaxID=126957 RepID=T1JL24_STRMM
MSEAHMDEYDRYNFEHDKYLYSGRSGKQRSKREVSEHTNHFDPSGHPSFKTNLTDYGNENGNGMTKWKHTGSVGIRYYVANGKIYGLVNKNRLIEKAVFLTTEDH